MKIFYRLPLLFLFLFVGASLSAQNSPLSFGVKAGVNLSNSSYNLKDINPDADKKAKVGFHFGVVAEYALTDAFALQSGLTFTSKGMVIKSVDLWIPRGESHITQTTDMQYLQLPILAVYKIEVEPGTKIFFNAGPYLSYGIGGKVTTKTRYVNLGDKAEDKQQYDTFKNNIYKKVDFGVIGGVGAEFGKMFVNLNYELGILDLAPALYIMDQNGQQIGKEIGFKNRNATLSVGYKF